MEADGGPAWGSASATVSLTTIPRYATSKQSLSSKTINSITMNWSSDSTIDYIWYSKDNGSNWTGINVTDGKSGSYTISSLFPNTTYKIKTRVRRKDSQLTTDSSATSVATYDIAKITEAPNVNIGSSHTIKWTNPSGATTTLKLCKTDGTSVYNVGTVTGTSKSVTPTASTIYALTPDANSITLRYIITTTANGSSYTNYKNVVFTVTNSNPTFSNCEYEDTGSVSTQLTGDNQTLINGYNVLKITISAANKAEANNSATMTKYRLVCGSKSVEATYSETEDVILQLNYVTSMTFIIYAIDSRGNSTAVTKSATTWKDYSAIEIKSASAERADGVGTDTTLTFEGTIWNDIFGAEANEITSCQYKYKKTNESEYGDLIDITPTREGDSFSFNSTIKGDLEADGFNVSNSFNIQIIVTDKIKTATYNVLLGVGTPAMAIHPNGVAFRGPYDENVGGALQAFGLATLDQLEIENLKTITDCNDTSLKTGFYYTDGNTLNSPQDGSAFFIQVMKRNDAAITQVAYRYRDNEIYERHYNTVDTEGWKDWIKLNSGGDLLWTNPSPSSSFATQTISLNTSKYNCFKIFAILSSANKIMQVQEVFAGYMGRFQLETVKATERYWRTFTANEDSIVFGDAKTYASSETTSNNLWIPIYIVGYKIN